MEIVYRKLNELRPNPKNPRKGTKDAVRKLAESIRSNPKFFEARPILLSDRQGGYMIIAGERRSEAARLLGLEEVPTILIQGLTEEQENEILIRDNTHSGEWDIEKLREIAEGWQVEKIVDWGVDKSLLRKKATEYTKNVVHAKLSNFIYEPQGEKPRIEDCVNTDDMRLVLDAIKGAKGLTKKEREIFEICAYRFCKIDFSKMAEYYAQSRKEVQEVMETNFLVIVDYEMARERGYVKMVERLTDLCDREIEEEDKG